MRKNIHIHGKLLQALVYWRKNVSQREGIELFRVLSNRTLEEIARLLPQDEQSLLRVYGIKEKKYRQYGDDILRIVRECVSPASEKDDTKKEEREDHVLRVSEYLDFINKTLTHTQSRVQGEVSSVQKRGSAWYFSLKDALDQSILPCFMWANDVALSGVEPEEGMEIVVHGYANIYKPTGRLSMRCHVLELVGEGALKVAYDRLKMRLEQEGLFALIRKRSLPHLPFRISIISSRDGAVIHDFLNNVGRYGLSLSFFDVRVEGAMAVQDIRKAIRRVRKISPDMLIVMRGGGSLESMQPFNNEMLIRDILDLPFPVVSAIGHHEDVPLFSLVADSMVSTPTAAAQTVNASWEEARHQVDILERRMLSVMEKRLIRVRERLYKGVFSIERCMRKITERFIRGEQEFFAYVNHMREYIRHTEECYQNAQFSLLRNFREFLDRKEGRIEDIEGRLNLYDPRRVLRLGYAIVRESKNFSIRRSVKGVSRGDEWNVMLSDGNVRVSCLEVLSSKFEKYEEGSRTE